jgi:N-acetylmuramoyl-L-alanine amidase
MAMRRPATRLLHVLLSVPVVTAAVIAASPTAHAAGRPAELVVVIDPGHGGVYNPAQPDLPYDPGAIAPSNGVMEKDAALSVSLQVRDLLKEDDVNALLTRSTDTWLTIQQRSDIANADGAAVFVSVHFNGFTDPAANGSLVLYPKDADLPFARAMSASMSSFLGPLGMSDRGVTLRDNWWIHTQMPTVTVEPAFLSNTHDASLVATPSFQQALAMSIRAGIESFDPEVLKRKAEIVAWNTSHPRDPVSAPTAARAHTSPSASTAPSWVSTAVRDVLLLSLLAAVLRWPRTAWLLVRAMARLMSVATTRVLVRRAARRRRRRALAMRSVAARRQGFARPRHVYDELA